MNYTCYFYTEVIDMAVDMSKFAAKVGSTVKKEKSYTVTDPKAPATFPQKKLLSVIFKNQGMVLDWKTPMTKGEASELISQGVGSLPAQKKGRGRW